MNITIIGTGFVGAVSAAVYASFKNKVTGLDIDKNKIKSLQKGKVPFYEPGLKELLVKQQKTGNLKFTIDYKKAVSDADLVIIAVGTPSKPSGEVDLKYVYSAAESLAPFLKDKAIVAVKSTVPPGLFEKLKQVISNKTKTKFHLAAIPEFLKEGTAVEDTLHPDRIVIGADNKQVINKLKKLYQPFGAPIVVMSTESAQMTKYTANTYLATRITFINQIANLCENNHADIEEVIEGIGYDKRIGHHYWYPGLGYGGSCFPKDVAELSAYAKKLKEDDNLVIKVNQLNQNRIPRLLKQYEKKVGSWKDKKIALLGLSFKPNTNDTREAPAGKIAPILLKAGADIFGYDPKAVWEPEQLFQGSYQQVKSVAKACKQADIIFVLIEWPEIVEFDYSQIKTNKKQFIFDTRNQLDANELTEEGFVYQGIGRKE